MTDFSADSVGEYIDELQTLEAEYLKNETGEDQATAEESPNDVDLAQAPVNQNVDLQKTIK